MNKSRKPKFKITTEKKSRTALLKFLVIVLPLWISAKFFNGPYFDFIQTYFAAIVLIILLGLLFQLVAPDKKAKSVLVVLFFILSGIEVLSIFAPGIFADLSFSIAGTMLIGKTYSIHMIPYYGVGGFIGYFILRACRIK